MTTISPPVPASGRRYEPMVPTGHSDDGNLALLLVSTWELRTGRTLPNVPASELSEQELIDFWADDFIARAHDLCEQ